MAEYDAPVRDMQFVLDELIGWDAIHALDGYAEFGPELVAAVLAQAAKLAGEVLAPLNRSGDVEGCRLEGDVVRTPSGWREAYQAYCDGGWGALPHDPAHGGQGLPKVVATAVAEMWDSANMAFGLCPLLTNGAIEAIAQHGSARLKADYLEHLVAGTWTGTMNLTEPQAGSDLSAVRTRAVPQGDHYLITGQKIFITYGEHDLTDNIVHLVLARLPDAPPGTRGISLFAVPKFLLDADGRPHRRNDLRCVSIEHKLGIHGSPTAVMSYGDQGGAVGYLVGAENRGLMHMFTMMNAARHAVGREGVALAEAAYQHALRHARLRVQGQPPGAAERAPIVEHADVKRMLMTIKAHTEAMRALTYVCAHAYDMAERHADAATRARAARRGDLLTPVVKAWNTETAQKLTSLGVQIHGGMGYVEETGAAQFLRDARITTIYEGTTGIQAGDLVGRKTQRDGGEAMRELIADLRACCDRVAGADGVPGVAGAALARAVAALERAFAWVLGTVAEPRLAQAAAVPYLELCGVVCGGWLMTEAARASAARLAAGDGDRAFHRAKLASAEFYARHVLPAADGLADVVVDGSAVVAELDSALL